MVHFTKFNIHHRTTVIVIYFSYMYEITLSILYSSKGPNISSTKSPKEGGRLTVKILHWTICTKITRQSLPDWKSNMLKWMNLKSFNFKSSPQKISIYRVDKMKISCIMNSKSLYNGQSSHSLCLDNILRINNKLSIQISTIILESPVAYIDTTKTPAFRNTRQFLELASSSVLRGSTNWESAVRFQLIFEAFRPQPDRVVWLYNKYRS